MYKKISIQELFIKLANPDQYGISRIVFTEEFCGVYSKLKTNNGGGWSRMDAKNILTINYNFISVCKKDIRFSLGTNDDIKNEIIESINKNEKIIDIRNSTTTNKIIAYKLIGFRKTRADSRQIRSDIREFFKNRKCVLLQISDIEIDHKNGRYNDPRVNNIETQTIEDFQPLSKPANDAKRQHCKNCKKTGLRFDAKSLGFKIGYLKGNEVYEDKPDGCVGCYWYDIYMFNNKHKDIEDLCT